MELTVLEEKKGRIVFELHDTDHTFCNALKQVLWEDSDVRVSAYNISHPLVGVPKFILESKDVRAALKKAAKTLQKKNKEFLTAFKKL
ncbi:MAG: DNA-directed RNA polymerase subunit L [Candidatus Woesearchaeota archaeon]|nr:DNA-directed RNA polymerase subunit L [Candidatus Woesearchaeota archaeon]